MVPPQNKYLHLVNIYLELIQTNIFLRFGIFFGIGVASKNINTIEKRCLFTIQHGTLYVDGTLYVTLKLMGLYVFFQLMWITRCT